jgi:hypothetical protein
VFNFAPEIPRNRITSQLINHGDHRKVLPVLRDLRGEYSQLNFLGEYLEVHRTKYLNYYKENNENGENKTRRSLCDNPSYRGKATVATALSVPRLYLLTVLANLYGESPKVLLDVGREDQDHNPKDGHGHPRAKAIVDIDGESEVVQQSYRQSHTSGVKEATLLQHTPSTEAEY